MLLFIGQLEESEETARRADLVITAIGAWCPGLFLSYGRAWRPQAEGRLAEACERYEHIEATCARVGLREPCEVPWAVPGTPQEPAVFLVSSRGRRRSCAPCSASS